MRRRNIVIALVVVVLVMVAVSRFIVKRGDAPRDTVTRNTSPPAAEALRVYVYRVEPRALHEEITAGGTLLANEAVELRSEITGKVVAIQFDEGALVNAGDLLVKINDSDLQAQLHETTVRIDLANLQAERQRQLVESGGTSREAYDTALNEVRVLEAQAAVIRVEIEKTQISAPFAGRIGRRFVSLGSYVTPDTTIATLQDVERLKIDFSVSERYMDRVHPGTRVTFSVTGSHGQHPGEVYAVEPKIDVITRTLILRARADNPGGRLLPGAYASVLVVVDEIPGALMVPTTAIVPGLNNRTLFVMVDGRAQARVVETGIRTDREIQILEGIKPGDVVITSGLLQLRSGLPVQAVHSPASTPRATAAVNEG